jgi:hypothetical protein
VKAGLLGIVVLVVGVGISAFAYWKRSPSRGSRPGVPPVFGFDRDTPGQPPAGFTFAQHGDGRPGAWVVRPAPDAPSGGFVLAQEDTRPMGKRHLLAISPAAPVQDGRFEVKCKAVAGQLDLACGIVFRLRDEGHYYLARADALDNNVRLYAVKGGERARIAEGVGGVTPSVWHTLRVDAKGDRFVVYLDERPMIDVHEATYPDAGRFGLWTKSDSVTWYDDLLVRPLP